MSTLLSSPSMVASLRRLVLETQEQIQMVDVTEQVADIIRATGLRDGMVNVFSKHTTAAVRIQEDEALLLQDLRDFLARLAPRDAHYGHNDFRVRTEHMHDDESPNGNSHCLHLLLGASESVPVMDGELQLGTWQRIFMVELDGPRPRRELLVQVLGTTD